MYEIKVVLEGVAPLLTNGWSEEALRKLDQGITGGTSTPEARHDEACEKIVWYDANGLRGVPAIPVDGTVRLTGVRPPEGALKKAIVTACRRTNLKERNKPLGTLLEATLFPDPDAAFAPVDVFLHRHWGRRPPRTGQACVIRRPALSTGWRLPVRLTLTDDLREPDQVRAAVDAAGILVAIGSWRPEYGRFVVAEWQVAGHRRHR